MNGFDTTMHNIHINFLLNIWLFLVSVEFYLVNMINFVCKLREGCRTSHNRING